MDNIQLTICAHREVTTGTVNSLEKMRLLSKLQWRLAIYTGDALIGRSRSRACTHFMEGEIAPYMLFIDDDIEFLPEHVERIYYDLCEGYDIVGGCYPVKGASQIASYGWQGQLAPQGQIEDVEFVGTGFMGISKRALKQIQEKLELKIVQPNDAFRCYPFFESGGFYDREPAIYISEDWDFCEKARRAGIRSHQDMTVWVGHRGYHLNTVDEVIQNQLKDGLLEVKRADSEGSSQELVPRVQNS